MNDWINRITKQNQNKHFVNFKEEKIETIDLKSH